MRVTQVVANFDKHGFHTSENGHMQLQNYSPNIMLSCGNKLVQSLAIINLCDPMGRSGFVRVVENLESHGILEFCFLGLESHGI